MAVQTNSVARGFGVSLNSLPSGQRSNISAIPLLRISGLLLSCTSSTKLEKVPVLRFLNLRTLITVSRLIQIGG